MLTSGPAASARPNGIYDVVVRGTGNTYFHKAFTPAGGWTDFAPIGGTFLSAPSVTYRQGSGEIDVVGVGTDSQLYHAFYAGGWSGWEPLGGGVSGGPSIISPASGMLDIYVRGVADHQLYQKSWTPGSGWGAFAPLGGSLTSGIAATAWDSNRRDVFARGTDGGMWIRSWTNTGGWAPWASLGGHPSSGPGAVATAPNRLAVFARGGQRVLFNGLLQHLDRMAELRLRAALHRAARRRPPRLPSCACEPVSAASRSASACPSASASTSAPAARSRGSSRSSSSSTAASSSARTARSRTRRASA